MQAQRFAWRNLSGATLTTEELNQVFAEWFRLLEDSMNNLSTQIISDGNYRKSYDPMQESDPVLADWIGTALPKTPEYILAQENLNKRKQVTEHTIKTKSLLVQTTFNSMKQQVTELLVDFYSDESRQKEKLTLTVPDRAPTEDELSKTGDLLQDPKELIATVLKTAIENDSFIKDQITKIANHDNYQKLDGKQVLISNAVTAEANFKQALIELLKVNKEYFDLIDEVVKHGNLTTDLTRFFMSILYSRGEDISLMGKSIYYTFGILVGAIKVCTSMFYKSGHGFFWLLSKVFWDPEFWLRTFSAL